MIRRKQHDEQHGGRNARGKVGSEFET